MKAGSSEVFETLATAFSSAGSVFAIKDIMHSDCAVKARHGMSLEASLGGDVCGPR